MTIIHVVEAFGGGIIEFIKNLTDDDTTNKQVVVYSTRGESIDSIKNRFRPDVEFIKWQFAGRGINPFKDFSAYFALKSIVRIIESYFIYILQKRGFSEKCYQKISKFQPFILQMEPLFYGKILIF
jgi:hypothetical protein